ncbi:MAG: hypothetical protein AB7F79_01535 [Steroidobacteraceae bacterium]
MNARVLLILLMITVLLALTKRYRRIGVPLSVVLMGLILWQTVNSVSGSSQAVTDSLSTSSVSSIVTLPASAVQLSHMILSGNGAPWRLSGEVTNTATIDIGAVKILITRRTCDTAETELTKCKVLWQGEHTQRIKLAAGASQSFEADDWSHTPVPRQVGVLRDQFEVIDVVQSFSVTN